MPVSLLKHQYAFWGVHIFSALGTHVVSLLFRYLVGFQDTLIKPWEPLAAVVGFCAGPRDVNWVLFQGNRFTEYVWLLRCDTTSFGWKQMPCSARLCNCRFTLEFVTLCLCANNPFPPTQIEPLIVVWFCSMNLGTLVAVWYVDVGH